MNIPLAGGGTLAVTDVFPPAPPLTGHIAFWMAATNGVPLAVADGATLAEAFYPETLAPGFTPVTYFIAYDGNGATGGSMPTDTATYDAPFPLPANAFTRAAPLISPPTNYPFAGWATTPNASVIAYDDQALVSNLTDVAGATVTVYAVWGALSVTNGDGTVIDTDPATDDARIGFDTDADGTADTFLVLPRGSAFDGTNLTVPAGFTCERVPDVAATNAAEFAGAAFTLAWQSSATDPAFALTLPSGGDITLPNGVWLDLLPAGSVFDALTGETALPNGGTVSAAGAIEVTLDPAGGIVAPASVPCTETYAGLPDPTRASYNFLGWKSPAGGIVVASDRLSAHGYARQLTAQWGRGSLIAEPGAGPAFPNAGTFNGVIHSAADIASGQAIAIDGTLNVKVSAASGKVSAKLALMGGSVSFPLTPPTIDGNGDAVVTLAAKGWTLNLTLRFNRVWGTATAPDGTVHTVDGAKNRFADKSDLAALAARERLAGDYTVVLPPLTPPSGTGYLTLKMSGRLGNVRIAGILANGQSVSRSVPMQLYPENAPADAAVPLFAPHAARKALVSGLLFFTPDANGTTHRVGNAADRRAFLRWVNTKPGAEFDLWLDAEGGTYVKPVAALPAFTFYAADPVFPWYDNKGADYAIAFGSAAPTLRFTANTGVWRGSLTGLAADARATKIKFTLGGVLLQDADGAFLPAEGFGWVKSTEPALRKAGYRHTIPVTLDPVP